MVRAPARLMREATGPQGLARSPPPGGALFVFELTRDEVGSRRSEQCAASARASLSPKISDSTFKQRRETSDRGPAARCARGFARTVRPKEIRGRRECRVPNAPAASRANEKSTRA